METQSNPASEKRAMTEQSLRRIIHLCEAQRKLAVASNDLRASTHNDEVKALAEIALRNLLA